MHRNVDDINDDVMMNVDDVMINDDDVMINDDDVISTMMM